MTCGDMTVLGTLSQSDSATYSADLDDVALLRRHLDGCPHSFSELVQRYHRQLWWAIRNSGVPAEHHSDVLQEGLLRIHRFARKFRGHGSASVGTWMVAIMRNVANTFWKQLGRHSSRTVAFEDYHVTMAENFAGSVTRLEDETVLRMDVHRALKQLPPELREVLVYTSLKGMSIDAFARQEGIPVGTVKSRRSRAKRRMSELLQPQEYLVAAAG